MDGVGATRAKALTHGLDCGVHALATQGISRCGDLLECDAYACHITSMKKYRIPYFVLYRINMKYAIRNIIFLQYFLRASKTAPDALNSQAHAIAFPTQEKRLSGLLVAF